MYPVATQYTTGAPVLTYLHLPNLERVRRWICGHPTGTQLTTSVRRLAKAVGCGAAAITPALRRLAADGWIDHLTAPSGTLIEVLVSDTEGTSGGDQVADHRPAATVSQRALPAQEVISTMIAGEGDQGRDRPMGNTVHADSNMQQQHASASDSADGEESPAGLTPTEWQTICALVPGYGEAQLRADLAKLKQRPGVRNPVGVLIAAYRRGEPVWGHDDLQAHNAAVTAQHVSTAADPPPPRRQRSDRRSDRAPAPAEPALLAPHGALWDHLLLLVPDASLVDWLCDGFALEVQAEATVLHCRQTDHALVARDLRGLLIDALRDIGLPDVIEIRAPEEQAVRDADRALSALSVVDHAPVPSLPAPAQLSAPEAHPATATPAEHAPTVPPARPATPPDPAGHAQPSTPPAPPASTAPSARAAPSGITDRPRRPCWSPWRAS